MSQAASLTSREQEIIQILRTLGESTDGFVVIGGYAVSALGLHRFSVDCDLAVDERKVAGIEEVLSREGYSKKTGQKRPKGVVMHELEKRMGRDTASVELYIDKVVSRATLGTWSYRFIRENSTETIVLGVTDSTPSRVVVRDLLAAMKLHASRPQDLSDIVVLSEGMDWNKVAEFSACGVQGKLARLLDSALDTISSPKFSSDLRATFAMRAEVTPMIQRTHKGLTLVRASLNKMTFKKSL